MSEMTGKQYEFGTIALNEIGDMILVWDEEAEAKMSQWVEQKMKEGCVFFILQPRAFGLLSPSKTKLKKLSELKNGMALSMSLDLFQNIPTGDTSIAIAERPDSSSLETTGRVAKTAKEVLGSQTMMVAPRKGG